MHRFRAKNPAHGFLQRASAGGKHKDAHHSDAAEPYRRTVLTLGDAEIAEQIVTDAIVQACVLRCSSPLRGCGIPADDLCLLAMQGAALARQAEADRERRNKSINAEGESFAAAAPGDASDVTMAGSLALQLQNLQSLVEIGRRQEHHPGVPAPLMTTIAELGSFLATEKHAAGSPGALPP
jgi:hypothetical protein